MTRRKETSATLRDPGLGLFGSLADQTNSVATAAVTRQPKATHLPAPLARLDRLLRWTLLRRRSVGCLGPPDSDSDASAGRERGVSGFIPRSEAVRILEDDQRRRSGAASHSIDNGGEIMSRDGQVCRLMHTI